MGTSFFKKEEDKCSNNSLKILSDVQFLFHKTFRLGRLEDIDVSFDSSFYIKSLVKQKVLKINNSTSKDINIKNYLLKISELNTIKLLKLNRKPIHIVSELGLEKKFVYNIYNKFKKNKDHYLNTDINLSLKNLEKEKNLNLEINQKPGRVKTFSKNFQIKLKYFLEKDENKFLTLKEIKDKFENLMKIQYRTIIDFSIGYYHKILVRKNEMNFSLKKLPNYTIYYDNSPEILQERKEFSRSYLFYKYNGYKFIFIDEFGISKSEHPNRGWSVRGSKISTKHSISQSANHSVICAFSDDFIINYQLFEGSARGSDFYSFILKMIKENCLLGKKYIFVLDNSQIHRNKLHPKMEKLVNFIFLPPYSPMLNPVEILFSYLKRKIRKKFYSTIEEVVSQLKEIIKEIKNEILSSFCDNLHKFIEKII